MTDNNCPDRVWGVIERVSVCMLTTRGAEGLRARPLDARPDRAAGAIWFLTDLRSAKGDEIAAEHDVGLAFIDTDENVYLSITGRAYLGPDRVKAAAIWKTSDKMWWEGPDDPNVGVLRATLLTAEMWDGPASNAVAVFEFVKSQVTGGKPNLGENRKTTIDMR
jgi:general stress protein 26